MPPLGQPPSRGRLGVISDTHGLLRPEALEALEGVDRILHAGDIGNLHHLDVLARIAPVTAIRGNIGRGAWAEALPETVTLTAERHDRVERLPMITWNGRQSSRGLRAHDHVEHAALPS